MYIASDLFPCNHTWVNFWCSLQSTYVLMRFKFIYACINFTNRRRKGISKFIPIQIIRVPDYLCIRYMLIMLQFWLSSFDIEIKYQNRYTVENYIWDFKQFLSMSLSNLRNVGNPFPGLSGKQIEELQLINQRHYCYVQLCKCLS